MIILVGGNGSIGSRYAAILRQLRLDFKIYDDPKKKASSWDWKDIKKVIIASPTEAHGDFCLELASRDIPFLCEKPLSKDLMDAKFLFSNTQGKPGYIVNNWAFALKRYMPRTSISYDFFKTGKDGLLWDCCQLIYLAKKKKISLKLRTLSPTWDFAVDNVLMNYREIEQSYLEMIDCFINGRTRELWTMEDGLRMSEEVLHLLDRLEGVDYEGIDWHSVEDELKAIPRKMS